MTSPARSSTGTRAPPDLADTLGHLPLALAQAAAYHLDRSLTCHQYRDRFLDRTRTLAEVLPDPDEDELPEGYRHRGIRS